MKKPFLYIILALTITTLLVIYKYLGGFSDPVITYEDNHEYIVAGKFFNGKLSDPEIERIFTEMRTLLVDGGHKGPVIMIWLREPKEKEDTVNVLIGLEIVPGETIPEHFEIERIEMNGLIRATIVGHTSVITSPAKVIEKIRHFARENNYELQDLVIDKYPSDSVVYTEIPVKI